MKIVCIGRNYSEHAKELNNAIPEVPLFFIKPDSAVHNGKLPYFIPSFTKDLHYELELVIKICKTGKHIKKQFASNYISGISVGIDFTARDIQQEVKTKGHPWELAKAFDGSAVLSKTFKPYDDFKGKDVKFQLLKNGECVQDGNSADMIFNVDEILEYVTKFVTLKKGDLIMTGTPSGVGKVEGGDFLEGFLEEDKILELKIKK
jgi:acylpyruvate hydrolase